MKRGDENAKIRAEEFFVFPPFYLFSWLIGTYYLLKKKNMEDSDGQITLIYYQSEDVFLLFSLKRLACNLFV